MNHRALALLAPVLIACEPAPPRDGRAPPPPEGPVWCLDVDNDQDCPDVDEASDELVGDTSCGAVVEEVLGLAFRVDRGDHAGCCYDVVEAEEQDTCD